MSSAHLTAYAFALVLAALPLSAGFTAAHETRVVGGGTVRAQPSNGGTVVNLLHAGQVVQVVECDRGIIWCFLTLPGADGWARSELLQYPVQPTLPCPPACAPKH